MNQLNMHKRRKIKTKWVMIKWVRVALMEMAKKTIFPQLKQIISYKLLKEGNANLCLDAEWGQEPNYNNKGQLRITMRHHQLNTTLLTKRTTILKFTKDVKVKKFLQEKRQLIFENLSLPKTKSMLIAQIKKWRLLQR